MIAFTKMHGAGNDFVVLDATALSLPPLERFSRHLCDRHFGVGADQVLVVEEPTPGTEADFRMDKFKDHPGEIKGNNDLLVFTQV